MEWEYRFLNLNVQRGRPGTILCPAAVLLQFLVDVLYCGC